jgi:hypothetical protein
MTIAIIAFFDFAVNFYTEQSWYETNQKSTLPHREQKTKQMGWQCSYDVNYLCKRL